VRCPQTRDYAAEPPGDRDVFGKVDESFGLDLSPKIGGQFADAEQPAKNHCHDASMGPFRSLRTDAGIR
jgi:hypothetical protein